MIVCFGFVWGNGHLFVPGCKRNTWWRQNMSVGGFYPRIGWVISAGSWKLLSQASSSSTPVTISH